MKMKRQILTTSNFNTLQSLCKEALNKSKFFGVVGYSGAGKTTAFKAYALGKQNVYYVKSTKSMPAKEFHRQVLMALGVEGKNFSMSIYDLIQSISARLNADGSRKLLIIDEAGKVKSDFLEYIHELRDNTEDTTGIIFAGPEYFRTNMEKWRDRGVVGVPELYRRINHWEELSRPTKAEVREFCHFNNINDTRIISDIFNTQNNFGGIQNYIDDYLESQSKIEIKTNV